MTAVEWLEEQVIKFHNWKLNQVFDENCFDEIELNKAIQQAKVMEKEQIKDAYYKGGDDLTKMNFIESEQYYKQTFKSE